MDVAVQVLVTMSILSYAVVAVAADLNRTHATNPRWVGHARFHLVWQSATHVGVGGVAAVLLWAPVGPVGPRVVASMAITAAVLVGFGVAAASMTLYAGEIADPNGYPPIRAYVGRRVELDQNALLFATAAVLLVAAVIMTVIKGGFPT